SEITKNEIEKLRKQISTLPQNSIVILDAKHELQRLEDENFWNHLSADKIEFLKSVVKPLFRTVSDTDFKAMRFEKDIVEVSLAKLAEEKEKFETLDRKSTRLNSSHVKISYAVFCLKKKIK